MESFETTPIDCALESLDGKSYNITAFTTHRVTRNMNVIDWNVCSQKWSHLKLGLKFHNLGSRPIVDILIGLDCVDLHYSIKDIKDKPDQPISRLTPLGWMCVGALGDKIGPMTHFATTYLH